MLAACAMGLHMYGAARVSTCKRTADMLMKIERPDAWATDPYPPRLAARASHTQSGPAWVNEDISYMHTQRVPTKAASAGPDLERLDAWATAPYSPRLTASASDTRAWVNEDISYMHTRRVQHTTSGTFAVKRSSDHARAEASTIAADAPIFMSPMEQSTHANLMAGGSAAILDGWNHALNEHVEAIDASQRALNHHLDTCTSQLIAAGPSSSPLRSELLESIGACSAALARTARARQAIVFARESAEWKNARNQDAREASRMM